MEITFDEYFKYQHHEARIPSPLRQGCDPVRHRVVIAGGGPTGLALALGLANYNIPVVVLEADDTVCSGSRAGAFTRRTLEILEQLGVIDEVMRTGHGWTTGWTYYRDKEVFQFNMPHDANQKYPPAISHLQNYIEHCMVGRAQQLGGLIDIRWKTQLKALQQDAEGARLEVETPDGSYALEADWVVACDGGRSTVRDLLGLRMQGKRHEGRYVIIDIRIDTEGLPVGRRCWFDPPSKPGGTLLMYKKPGNMLRFDYQLNDDDDEVEEMKPERVFAQVDQHLKMMGIDRKWAPVWMSLYRASALTLDSYLHERVLFAGDAAHLVPIFGVRGMNSAIDDAHNLAWKLAFVAKGLASPRLLESYSSERVHAARENHRFASKGAEFMAPPSAPFRLMRDAVLSLSERHPWITSLMNPRQHAAIPLLDSSLNASPQDSAAFRAGPVPGDILRECPLEINGQPGFLSDLLGPHFSALYFSEAGELSAALAAACGDLATRVPFQVRVIARRGTPPNGGALDAQGQLLSMYGAQVGSLYLVRPDGHVMARWLDADPQALVSAIEQALSLQEEVCHV
ncbi:FAD-dependent monooxygenase [Polaromonas sp. SM01]|uniref:FAD-dependent monooxygenase n=1 Tax=Polaromonas sp. SM01 TaxID=3085630 RepID=UPI002980F9B8|nr:FAD-dependent monooxygenase [Polaromonas sp. SM01]MDW5441905.1 FAD-dependent monooxygenase [Polaromonas sp. SM01]